MSDFPDWFGQPQFPQLGNFTLKEFHDAAVEHGYDDDTISIFAKGRIYTGSITIHATTKIDCVYLSLTIDNAPGAELTLPVFVNKGSYLANTYLMECIYYNTVTGDFLIAIQPDITFVNSFKVHVRNLTFGNIAVSSRVYYAKITA